MQRFVIFITTIICASYILVPHAQANSGLSISPKRVVFEDGQRVADVVLSNASDEAKTFRVSLVNKAMTEQGHLKLIKEPAAGEFFADDVLLYAPREVMIGPGKVQKLRLMSRLAEDAAEGEYRSHILFEDASVIRAANDYKPVTRTVLGVSIPVILRKGILNAEVKLSASKIMRRAGDVSVEFDIERSGSKSIIGTARVFKDQKQIGILKNISAYLSVPKRHVSIKIDSDSGDLKGEVLRLVFEAEDGVESDELSFKVTDY